MLVEYWIRRSTDLFRFVCLAYKVLRGFSPLFTTYRHRPHLLILYYLHRPWRALQNPAELPLPINIGVSSHARARRMMRGSRPPATWYTKGDALEVGADAPLYHAPCNRPTPALCRSGYTWPEAIIKLNIALDHILRRVASGPHICP